MPQQFVNAGRTELATAIAAGDTTLTLDDGSSLPSANAGSATPSSSNDWFRAVIQQGEDYEVILVRTHDTASSPNTLSNVLRGQEGTTARSWSVGSVVGNRWTAADASGMAAELDALRDVGYVYQVGTLVLTSAHRGKLITANTISVPQDDNILPIGSVFMVTTSYYSIDITVQFPGQQMTVNGDPGTVYTSVKVPQGSVASFVKVDSGMWIAMGVVEPV